MRVLCLGVVATALVCAGCTGDGETEAVEITTTDEAGRTTVVTQEVTEEPEPTGQDTGEAAPTTATLVETTLTVPGGSLIAFDMPDTWTVVELGAPERTAPPDPTAQAPRQWCLVPPDELPAIDGCAGILLAAGPDWLPGHAGAAYSTRQVDGWRSDPAPLPCPFADDGTLADEATATSTPDAVEVTGAPTTPDEAEVDLLITTAEGLPLTTSQSEVNGRMVTYETWRATCSLTEDVAVTPQVWHDLDLGVLVRDYFGSPESVGLVASLREG